MQNHLYLDKYRVLQQTSRISNIYYFLLTWVRITMIKLFILWSDFLQLAYFKVSKFLAGKMHSKQFSIVTNHSTFQKSPSHSGRLWLMVFVIRLLYKYTIMSYKLEDWYFHIGFNYNYAILDLFFIKENHMGKFSLKFCKANHRCLMPMKKWL